MSSCECVECHRQRRREARAANLEKARERDRESARKHRAADPERVRENWRRWRAANLEKAREGERLRHNKRYAAQRRAPDQSLTEPAAPAHQRGISEPINT